MQINSMTPRLQQPCCPKGPPRTPPEVAAFMAKLGLTPTNSKEGDQQAIMTKLAEIRATGEVQKADALKDEFSGITGSISQPEGPPPGAPPPPPQEINFAGMEQLAAMNKHFLVN